MSDPIRDPEKIDWFLDHAVEHVYPTREALRTRMLTGPALKVYHGIDPTGPTLHLGHTVPLRKLAELQALGHEVVLLIGDFTAMIGDPTDKTATRKKLTREEVLENCKLYKKQAARILRFDGPNPVQFRFNSEWLATMSFADVVELASHFTVQQMLERDMFEKRIAEGKPVHLHEFLYPLMQGQDSVAIDVDLEIGGNDQTFNMLAGRTLQREVRGKEKFVLTNRLLSDPTGKKMGKSEGNMLSFLDAPEDMYGKVMSWSDSMILPALEICTLMSPAEINQIRERLAQGENPKVLKDVLAREIVKWLVDDAAAEAAAEHFVRVHQQGEKPVDIKEYKVGSLMIQLVDALVQGGLVDSKSEARRQIEQGGIKVDDVVATDVKMEITIPEEGVTIQKGKRFFVKLVV